jgi:Transglycosylase SLT domain
MRLDRSGGRLLRATWIGAAIVLALVSASAHASDAGTGAAAGNPETITPRAAIRKLIEQETAATGLPADIAEAVLFVESGYDPAVIGGVGEIGLMQVRPQTAAMLGFHGSHEELAKPEINIHYGVLYLSRAWRLAGGDLCRALMKYRAGHGEEIMSPRSQVYCNRARNRLFAMNSASALPGALAAVAPLAMHAATVKASAQALPRPTSVYATYRQGTAAASRAFWAAHDARVRLIRARIEARWNRVASR